MYGLGATVRHFTKWLNLDFAADAADRRMTFLTGYAMTLEIAGKHPIRRNFLFQSPPFPRNIGFVCQILLAILLGSGVGSWSVVYGQEEANAADASPAEPDFGGPIRIVRLLWDASPQSAANTLVKTIGTAASRKHLGYLAKALTTLEERLEAVASAQQPDDPRFGPSVAACIVLDGDKSSEGRNVLEAITLAIGDKSTPPADASLIAQVWFVVDPGNAFLTLEQQLQGASSEQAADRLPPAAVLVPAAFDEDRVRMSALILENWERLTPALRLNSIEPLTASKPTMLMLTKAIERGLVSKDLVNTNQLRKWLAAGDADLTPAIESVWGRVRANVDQSRQEVVSKIQELLDSGKAGSVSRGQEVFTRVCSQCHVLHGQGYEVGPNIANNGRGSLEQLVSNVMDPSLVIGEAFQARTVLTVDGEIVAGLVAAETDKYLRLKIQGGKTVEFDKQEDVEAIKISDKSLMPEGIEEQLKEQEILDLFAFLCLLKPLDAADNSLIPGTPDALVTP